MFKNIISPVQAWLLSQGRCVGCGTDLKNGRKEKLNKLEDEVACKKCGRIFIYNRQTGHFRRAPLPVST
ncbi:hypothetical protein FJY90_05250 [Candidatus Gottesmanbacteria bacterium]|nr:hypothetical protein [Candidatus Gottesmanbacteria bacterium]